MAESEITVCRDCGQDDPNEFCRSCPTRCRKCRSIRKKKWAEKSKDRIREYGKTWRAMNVDHRARSWRTWYDINGDAVLARMRGIYYSDVEQARARARAKYAANRKSLLAATREWQKRNPIKMLAQWHRKRVRKRSLPILWSHSEIAVGLAFWSNLCAACGSDGAIEWDHWIPLASHQCPGTIHSNMVPLCQQCNRSKHDTLPDAWLKRTFPTTWEQIKQRIESYLSEQ